MGVFSGGLRFTVYRGTNLLRLEAVARTDEPSVAYIYRGRAERLLARARSRRSSGMTGVSDPSGRRVSGGEAGKLNVLRARNRLAVAGGKAGRSPSSRRRTSSSSPVSWR